jgi:hypothetical protein
MILRKITRLLPKRLRKTFFRPLSLAPLSGIVVGIIKHVYSQKYAFIICQHSKLEWTRWIVAWAAPAFLFLSACKGKVHSKSALQRAIRITFKFGWCLCQVTTGSVSNLVGVFVGVKVIRIALCKADLQCNLPFQADKNKNAGDAQVQFILSTPALNATHAEWVLLRIHVFDDAEQQFPIEGPRIRPKKVLRNLFGKSLVIFLKIIFSYLKTGSLNPNVECSIKGFKTQCCILGTDLFFFFYKIHFKNSDGGIIF